MAETITMPKLGFDMAEGTLVRWAKNEGENVNKGDVLAEIETDKATVEVESSASGVVRKLLVDAGAIVPIGAPIAIIGSADEKIDESKAVSTPPSTKAEIANPTPPKAAPIVQSIVAPQTGPLKASPLAKKMARDTKVDLAHVQGTGPGGRIVRKDIENILSAGPTSLVSRASIPAYQSAIQTAPTDETIGLTKLRQAIARRQCRSTVASGADFQRCWGRAQIRRIWIADAS